MRMSNEALASLYSALIAYGAARDCWGEGNADAARINERERDTLLRAAGLPDMSGLWDAYCAHHGIEILHAVEPRKPRKPRSVQPRPSMSSMVQAVREHALANYGKDGWDYLVECWEDADIEEAIGNARTYAGAIKACRATVRLLDERRDEIMRTVW